MSRLGKISFLFSGISLVCMVLVRYLAGDWVPFCWIALGLFVFFLGFGLFNDRRVLAEFFTLKTTKHGMSMGVLIVLVLAFLIVVNFLSVRHYKTFDLSMAKSNTLSEQSIKLLKSLDAPLNIYFFYKKGVEGNEESRRSFRDLVKKYQDQSDKVQLNFIEVNERPDLAKDFGVDKGSGIVFLDYKGHRNRIDKIEEQDMSTALVKVTRDKKRVLYFVSGHGEKNLDETKEAEGLNALKLLLENNSYEIKTWVINENPKGPADADMVLIFGPTQEYLPFELNALENYLKSGGSIFLALKSQQSKGFDKLLAKIGLKTQNNFVLSVETLMGKETAQGLTLGTNFSPTSEITKGVGKDQITLFLYPEGLTRLDPPPQTVALDDLVRTNANAVAFNTLDFKGQQAQGPFTLAVSAKGKYPGADAKAKDFAMVVVGDPEFANNQLLYKNLNRDLILNSVASLVKEENLISISPKEPQKTEMMLTQTNFTVFLFAFIIPLPLLLLATSATLWMRRRNA